MIRTLAAHVGSYARLAVLVPFVVLLEVMCELAIPLLMARIIDIGIADQDVAYIGRIGLYMVLLALTAIVLGVANMWLSTTSSMGFGANLRDALFAKVQTFSFANIDDFSTASLVTRMTNDVNNLQLTLMMMLRILMRAPMMLVIAFFLAYSINAELSGVLAVAIPLLVLGMVTVLRAAVTRFGVVQERIDAINRTIQENLIGQRVVKAFVRSEFEIAKFKTANDALTDAFIRAVSVVILGMPLMMLVINGATLAIVWLGGRMVYAAEIGPGGLIGFLSYVMQILMSVMMISMVFVMAARAQASARRVTEVLAATVDIVDSEAVVGDAECPRVTAGRVEFRDVSFRYSLTGTGRDVLSHVSFAVEPGEVVAVVGGTGTGKSTLVNLIPRLYDVTGGAVLVDGRDVRDYRLEELRAGVGVVLQQNTLFSGTVRENLLWGQADATQEEIETACRDAQAHDFIVALTEGYDTRLGQSGVNLSGGQKQRLCIARAILRRPRILVLDDSTSSVDSATEARIRASFAGRLAGTTVFIIAQRLASIRDADRIVVLDDGRVIGVGTHEALLASCAVYREINQSQQQGVLA